MSVRFAAALRLTLAGALPLLVLPPLTAAAQAQQESRKPEKKKPEAKKPDAKPADKKAADRKAADKKPEAAPAAGGSGVPGNAKLVASFGDWGAYTAQTSRSRLCYALSEPKSRSPANLKGTKAYLFVSFRPADRVRNELAAVLNFKTKEKGEGSLSIGDMNYDLITLGENAWIRQPSDENLAVTTMQKGGTVTVQVTSAKGNKTTDRYSLAGFSQALDQAKRDCP